MQPGVMGAARNTLDGRAGTRVTPPRLNARPGPARRGLPAARPESDAAALRAALPADERWMVTAYGD